MTADDEIRTTRFAEIGAVLTACVEDTQALLTKGQNSVRRCGRQSTRTVLTRLDNLSTRRVRSLRRQQRR